MRDKSEVVHLEQRAAEIPSMGGAKLAQLLRRSVREAPAGTAVVEVGSWLGAGTAQLAIGVGNRSPGEPVTIHCYDRWKATAAEVKKACRNDVVLTEDGDLLPTVRDLLQPFQVPIHFHQGELSESRWNGQPIGVYVDDASKTPPLFCHALLTFGASWIPGQTVLILMDYHDWKKDNNRDHKCQKNFIEAHDQCFESIQNETGDISASFEMFRYVAPLDLLSGNTFKDLWRLWLQVRNKRGLLDLVKSGYILDFYDLMRVWLRLQR